MEQWKHFHKTVGMKICTVTLGKKIHQSNNQFLSIYYESNAFLGDEETEGKF